MWEVIESDALEALRGMDAESVHCCVTSPPYFGLRDYGVEGQVGLEETPGEYVATLVEVFGEVRRVLRDDGTLWIVIGDSYANDGKWGGETGGKQHYLGEANRKRVGREKRVTGLPPKSLIGIPWRVAFALQADGWHLRSDIIWAKPSPMPESVKDRPTKAHEYIFLLSKSAKYFYDADAIREPFAADSLARVERGRSGNHKWANGGPGDQTIAKDLSKACGNERGRNRRTVWTVAPASYSGAHFATFPTKLIEPCILAGCPVGGTVLDPFSGAGTTGIVALRHGRDYLGIELSPEYAAMSRRRIELDAPLFNSREDVRS